MARVVNIELKSDKDIDNLTHEELLSYTQYLDDVYKDIKLIGLRCFNSLQSRVENLKKEIQKADQDVIDGYYNYHNFIKTKIH